MCIIDNIFQITTTGNIFFNGKSYKLEDCEFKEGAKLIIQYDEKNIDKAIKKPSKIKPTIEYQLKETDMFLMPLDEPVMMTAQAQPVQPIHSTIELPPEINQFEQLMKITKDNTPLALIILIVLMFQKMQKKDRDDKDHSLICDFERKEIEKKINILESRLDDQGKNQARILVNDDDLVDRLDKVEERIKKINASLP